MAWADSTVVFNEVMYHPQQLNEAAFEWVELRNQMAVDMDLSGWSLEEGIDYLFPEGTVIPGGGYLVVAGSPADLTAATGVTNVCGPFTGRLSNSGEKLELRNNNHRLMDVLEYGTDDTWPVAPDGTGPSLAKIDEDSASADPANWRASPWMDGTPGLPNTPPVSIFVAPRAIRLTTSWRFLTDGTEPVPGWKSPGYDDAGWASGRGVFYAANTGSGLAVTQAIASLYSSGLDDAGQTLPPGYPDPHYVLTASAYSTPPPPDIPATVMANHSAWLANNATSRWIGAVASGTTGVPGGSYVFRTTFDLSDMQMNSAHLTLRTSVDNQLTNVFLNGVAQNGIYGGFSSFSPLSVLSNGFTSATNTLDFCAVNSDSAGGPSGFRVELFGTAVTRVPTNTALPATAATKYFRTAFVVNGDPMTALLRLQTVTDDGAVFYLNGAEVLRLNLPGGLLTHGTTALTNVAKAILSEPYNLSAASLVTGTNVLAAEVHQAASGSNDLLFGAELSVSLTNGLPPHVPTIAINELPSVTNHVFWAELINYGTQSVSLSNFLFKRFGTIDQECLLPPHTLPPGGRTVLDRVALGFGADPGDRLMLYTSDKAAVVDAVVAKSYPRARWPEGTGSWRHPSAATPGTTNRVSLRDDIVINEIMYHPRNPQGPAVDSPEQWIELFNRGPDTVNLGGWRLEIDGETAFRFPEGRTLTANGTIVVARDAAFLQNLYPTLDLVGDLAKRLPGRGGKIELFDNAGLPLDPEVSLDAGGNPADLVRYGDNSPWPSSADGLGATLELRDPRADNSCPEAWAASDERGLASWQTVTYSGIATAETANSPTLWKEFVLGLIGEGEVLLDDLSLVEAPAGAATQLIQNGTFESGTNAWRIIGNHRHSEVIDDPDNAANHVLRLVASGYTEHMHNHAETTLANGAAVIIGREYQISFRAKWVAGCNRLLTRLYFNRLPRLTELAVPESAGTPGARNSCYTANLGPTFSNLAHQPAVPTEGEPVSVSVTADDPDGVATGVLQYAVNGGTWQSVPMTAGAAAGREVPLGAVVPGQTSGSIVQFYVEAADGLGTTATCPEGGMNARALFAVSDGTAILPKLRSVRIVMTAADAAFLHSPVNVMSNERLGCTLITDERTVAYDASLHLQGSERSRNSTLAGYTVFLPSDRRYRGTHDTITINRNGGQSGLGGTHDEILLKHAITKAGGLPGMYDDLCQVFAPRAANNGTGLLILAKYGNEFLDTQYADGGNGEMFKLELIYYPLSNSVPGDVQSPKLPSPDKVIGTDIMDLGNEPEAYRWIFNKENRTDRSHYAPMVALAKAFSLTGAALDAQTRQLMDVDEWMRGVAFISLIGGSDIYTYGNSHNAMIYFRPEDGKAMLFPWDMDYSFMQATNSAFPGTGSPNTTKIINLPANLHAYYGHLYDLTSVTGDAAYMGRWASRYAGLLGQNWSGVVTYLKNRADYVRGKLPLATPFAITTHFGNGFGVTNSPVTLAGTGSVTVKTITVNGVEYPVTWTSATNWAVTVPLPESINLLTLQAYDLRGQLLTDSWDTLCVTNFGLLAPRPVVINEWMADNSGPAGFPDMADQKFQDWIELYNPNDTPINLTGYTLTDDLTLPAKWAIPTNTVIAPRGFLLVWADDEAAQNGTGTNSELHAAFKLSNNGESLGLFSPDGVRQNVVTFGSQLQNMSQGYHPDGNTNAIYSMPDWSPNAPNRLGPLPAPDVTLAVQASNTFTFVTRSSPGHATVVQYKNDLRAPDWLPLGTNRALTDFCIFTDIPAGVTQRFYRAVLLQ